MATKRIQPGDRVTYENRCGALMDAKVLRLRGSRMLEIADASTGEILIIERTSVAYVNHAPPRAPRGPR